MSTLDCTDSDFGLPAEIEEIRQQVRRFAARQIAPRAADIDRSNEFPRDLWPALGSQGLLGITVPERFGGAGASLMDALVVIEELAKVCRTWLEGARKRLDAALAEEEGAEGSG